jgi:hypothetical protein
MGLALRGQVPFGQGPLQRLAVEQHGHREPQAQLFDTRAQVGQVDTVQVHAGAVDRLACRYLLDCDQRPGERGFGVDVDPLVARGDDAARGRVQAL